MPEAPSLEDQPIDAPEPPESQDQPSGEQQEPESFADFDYSDIPDELREDVEKRVKGFQASYTKAMQGVSEKSREAEQAQKLLTALRNPQVAPAVLAQLGYNERKMLELYGYQPGDDEVDEEPDLYQEVQGLKQTIAQRAQAEQAQQQEAAVTDYIAGEIEAVEKEFKSKNGRDFTLEEQQLLDAYARQFAIDTPAGRMPDVKGAYGLLTGALSSHQKALLDPKRNVPRVPGNGKSASRTVDLSKESKEEFVSRQAQAVDEARASAQ